jgi:hypothetical protein
LPFNQETGDLFFMRLRISDSCFAIWISPRSRPVYICSQYLDGVSQVFSREELTEMRFASIAAATALMIAAASAPVQAKMDEEDVGAALAILGLAALAHNEHHYREGYQPSNAQETADFERGYRDGLHDAAYDSRRSSVAYGQGYDAGHADRANRLSHRTREESKVPHSAILGCAQAVARNFAVGVHDVHITRTVYRQSNDYLVEAAVGHQYMSCAMGDSSSPVDVFGGRIQ